MPGFDEIIGGISNTKSRLLLFAGIVVIVGVFLNLGKWLPSQNASSSAFNRGSSVQSSLTEQPRFYVADVKNSKTWGDAAIQLGLSFMIAMVVASLLRAFVKTMLSVLLMAFVVCWFLSYKGMIDPFWERYYSSFADTKNWTMSQTNTITSFLKGYVPSVGAALVGFGFGLKR